MSARDRDFETATDRGPGMPASFEPLAADEATDEAWADYEYIYQDESILVRIGDDEVVLPAMTRVWSAKHESKFPLGGYGPGAELFMNIDGDWVDVVLVSKVWDIPEENLGAFRKAFERMAKKAAKLGAATPTFAILGERPHDLRTPQERKQDIPAYYRIFYQIIVRGEGPRLKGWRFLGTIDPGEGELAAGTYLLKMVPSEAIPERFKDMDRVDPTACEHCGKHRRRKKTFILEREADGATIQVGSSCIKDFLGHRSPQLIAAYLQWLAEAGDEFGHDADADEGGHSYAWLLLYDYGDFLPLVACSIREDGWLSKSAARDTSRTATADMVLWALHPKSANPQDAQEKQAFRARVTGEDRDVVKKALKWAPALWEEGVSDYGINMQVALRADKVSDKTSGLVASLIFAYLREHEQLLRKATEEKVGRDSQHVGEVGQRIDVGALTVVSTQTFENAWGTTLLIKMITDEGDRLTWWYGGEDEFKEEMRYRGTCGIKKHDIYRGVAETTVQRCSLRRLDRVYAKLTRKQAEVVKKLDISEYGFDHDANAVFHAQSVEAGDDVAIRLVGTLLVIEPDGIERARQLLDDLDSLKKGGKPIIKKILVGFDESDLEL